MGWRPVPRFAVRRAWGDTAAGDRDWDRAHWLDIIVQFGSVRQRRQPAGAPAPRRAGGGRRNFAPARAMHPSPPIAAAGGEPAAPAQRRRDAMTNPGGAYKAREMNTDLAREIARLRDQARWGWDKEARNLGWF